MPVRLLLSIALALSSAGTLILITTTPAQATAPEGQTLSVVMYSTQACPYCEKARQWFASRNIAWVEHDIESSEKARSEWKTLGGMGTPLIMINGKRFNGFSEGEIAAEVARQKTKGIEES
jgi:glutaredoxin